MGSLPKAMANGAKVSPVKLAHIVLRSPDAARLVQWYCSVLEAEVVASNAMVSFMTYDDEHHRIAVVQMPGIAPASRETAGMEHVAFTYASAEDLFSTYERLKNVGIEPFWTINHGPTLSFYYRDPDNNQVELQIDLQPDAASANAWLAKSDFASNPIGVKFDPDDLIARFRAGEPASELFERPVIDPSQVMAQFPGETGSAEAMPTDRNIDISGAWNWTLMGPMSRSGTARFNLRGDVLEGFWEGQVHRQEIQRGTWRDGIGHWELDVDQPVKGTITADVTYVEGELRGRAVLADIFDAELVLTRPPESGGGE